MAAIQFPSFAYNQVANNPQPPQIVQTQAALTALGSAWATSPFPPGGAVPPPFDINLQTTDARLQQQLVEARITNLLLQQGFNLALDVDGTGLRADVVANDSSLTS